MRRVGEVSLREWLSTNLFAGRDGRRTAGAGSNLAPFSSPNFSRAGMAAPHNLVPKPTPANLRRFAETPVARRAINAIKDRIVGMRWRIQPRRGRVLEQIPDGAQRIQVLTENFEAPNPDDSFRSLVEQVLEDVIVGGFGAIELDLVEGWTTADCRRDAGATSGDVAGGRGDDPDHDGLGWASGLAALCAGDGVVWGAGTDRAER